MQYGAAGMRNLATDLKQSGCNNRCEDTHCGENDKNQTNIKHITHPNTTKGGSPGEERRDDENNRAHLEKTLKKLYNDTKEKREQSTRDPRDNNGPEGSEVKWKEISQQESDNLKLQVEVIKGLRYDTIGTINILLAMQRIDREGSWYHTTAEKAKTVLRFRQAASHKLIEQGIEASKGITRAKTAVGRTPMKHGRG